MSTYKFRYIQLSNRNKIQKDLMHNVCRIASQINQGLAKGLPALNHCNSLLNSAYRFI